VLPKQTETSGSNVKVIRGNQKLGVGLMDTADDCSDLLMEMTI
jgi:hypothetical protein